RAQTAELLDRRSPAEVIATAILPHVTDAEDPVPLITAVKEAVPAGSALFISHFRTLGDPDSAAMESVLQEAFGRGAWRTDAQIAEYFAGTDLLEPGIV